MSSTNDWNMLQVFLVSWSSHSLHPDPMLWGDKLQTILVVELTVHGRPLYQGV